METSVNYVYTTPSGGIIYLGNLAAANNAVFLKEKNIKKILGYVDGHIRFSNVDYLVFENVYDSAFQNMFPLFKKSFEFIRNTNRGEGVLIHCYAGISRSSTILISYLMYEYNMRFSDVLNLVRRQRNIVQPNDGFIKQLSKFDEFTDTEKKDFIERQDYNRYKTLFESCLPTTMRNITSQPKFNPQMNVDLNREYFLSDKLQTDSKEDEDDLDFFTLKQLFS